MGTVPVTEPYGSSLGCAPSTVSIEHERRTAQAPSDSLASLSALRQAVEMETQSVELILNAVADGCRILTGADGIALALRQNGRVVCRARSGEMAPELGAPLNVDSGISGECLRSTNILFCHDALSDERVDADVCRRMGIRSIVAVPLRGEMGMAGVLEAFSSRVNAFDGDALNSLRAASEVAEKAYARERGEIWCSIPAALTEKPATPSAGTAVTQDSVDEVPKDSRSRVWIIAGIVVALLLTFSVAWWSWRQSGDEVERSVQAAHPTDAAKAVSSQAPQGAITPKPGPGILAAGGSDRRSNPAAKGILHSASQIEPEHDLTLPSDPPESTGSRDNTAGISPESRSAIVESEAPPAIDLAKGEATASLPSITAMSAKLPTLEARVSQGATEPKLIQKVDPIYPPQARAQRLSGKVTMEAVIGKDGTVREARVVNGLPELADAARTALLKWRYSPALLNGSPVEVEKQITFVFRMPQ